MNEDSNSISNDSFDLNQSYSTLDVVVNPLPMQKTLSFSLTTPHLINMQFKPQLRQSHHSGDIDSNNLAYYNVEIQTLLDKQNGFSQSQQQLLVELVAKSSLQNQSVDWADIQVQFNKIYEFQINTAQQLKQQYQQLIQSYNIEQQWTVEELQQLKQLCFMNTNYCELAMSLQNKNMYQIIYQLNQVKK